MFDNSLKEYRTKQKNGGNTMNEKTIEITAKEYKELLTAKIQLETLRMITLKRGAFEAGDLARTLFTDGEAQA